MEFVTYNKKLEIAGDYDVIVCGAGPSGVCAAITSARNGKKTLLIENAGCLGGYWTAGLMGVTLDMNGKGGLAREIYNRLSSMNSAKFVGDSNYIYDPEILKALLEDLCAEAGVETVFYTRVIDAVCSSGKISSVVTASSAGCRAYTAKVFLDCTGNGELAAYAGCSYEAGHPDTGQLQPASLHALVTGVPDSFEFILGNSKHKKMLRELLRSVGVDPSYQAPLLYKLCHGDLWSFAITHQYNVGYDSPEDMTRAIFSARKEINRAVSALRTIPGWEKLRIAATAEQLGLREGRRIKGLYKITSDDLIQGKKHEDAVCLVKYPVDIHALNASSDKAASNANIQVKPYHIPYRSLVSAELSNLGMGGRCISGDFYAHASYRVIGNAAATGEAIGYGAAIAAGENKPLSAVDGKIVAEYMKKMNHEL